MKILHILPRHLRRGLIVIVLNVLLFTLFRGIFWVLFRSTAPDAPLGDFLWAWYLGFKFDLRLSLIVFLPVLVLSWIPGLNPFRSSFGRRFWLVYLCVALAFLIFAYFADLAHFGYLHERLNATALDYLFSKKIALQFIWETYPVIPGILAILLVSLGYGWVVKRYGFRNPEMKERSFPLPLKAAAVSCALLLYGFGIYGKWSRYPLRWSDAFFSTNPFVSALSLNPMLYFVDTLSDRVISYDEKAVRDNYELMADLLEVDSPDKNTLNFIRHAAPRHSFQGKPNIVLIHLESYAGFKVGALGCGLDPTPEFDAIARKSILFTHFFVTRPPTARAVFTVLFGTPDINPSRSASRNPLVVHQHTLVNALEGYKKFFFIGGSASWGNIRAMLAHNIPGIEIYEEGDFQEPPEDVWGISDLQLVQEANRILRAKEEPFFAFILTAANHRPYTIPEDKGAFEPAKLEEDLVIKHGFESLAEYNSMRFLDYSLGEFFRLASKEDYFNNTVFALFGDHGTIANKQVPWEKIYLTTHHVPFALYAPGYLSGGRVVDITSSLVDVLPTVLSFIGIPYVNQTMGRDLLMERPKVRHFAFVNSFFTGLLNDDFYLFIEPTEAKRLYAYRSSSPTEDIIDRHREEAESMSRLCNAILETSNYLLYHNPPLERLTR